MEHDDRMAVTAGSGLVAATIGLMYVFSMTGLAPFIRSLFSTLIVGVLVIGAMLTGGAWIARKGLDQDDMGMAAAGAGLLALGYGAFGSAIIYLLPAVLRVEALLVTLVISVAMTVLCAAYVYRSDRDFRWAQRYSTYCFLGVLLFALIGTFTPLLATVAFLLGFAGFTLYLLHELWRMRDDRAGWRQNALGIYIAFMGVFVHILQIVVQMYMDR